MVLLLNDNNRYSVLIESARAVMKGGERGGLRNEESKGEVDEEV
jgi:hypothetical protein